MQDNEHGMAAPASCALDDVGLHEQRKRYRRLADSSSVISSAPQELIIEFDDSLDRELLEQTLAVEQDCCAFFVFDYDNGRRRLRVTVSEADKQPALEAIAAAFARERLPAQEA